MTQLIAHRSLQAFESFAHVDGFHREIDAAEGKVSVVALPKGDRALRAAEDSVVNTAHQ